MVRRKRKAKQVTPKAMRLKWMCHGMNASNNADQIPIHGPASDFPMRKIRATLPTPNRAEGSRVLKTLRPSNLMTAAPG